MVDNNNKLIKVKFLKDFEEYKFGQELSFPFYKAHTLFNLGIVSFEGVDKGLVDELTNNPVQEKDFEGIHKHLLKDAQLNKKLDLFIQNKEDIAEELHQINPFFYDKIGLFWFWNHQTKCYEVEDEIDILNEIKKRAENTNFQITGNKFWTEIIRALKLVGRQHTPKEFQKTWIQFKDKVYDYKMKEFFEATPEYFNCNPIPYKLGTNKETPMLDGIFESWVGKDLILTLKETIALSLIQDYPLHRIIILFGSGLNGKGCFLRFLVNFIGVKNICSSNLTKILKNNFESSKLYKKLACIMGETDFATISDTSMIKQLTGQDLITAEFKGKNSFDFVNNALIFIASNSLPISMDRTQGFYRRPLIIDFPNKFIEGIDIIETIPQIEYENLALHLVDLLPELIQRGRFDKDGDIDARMNRYEERSNPLNLFIKENYVKNMNQDIPFFEFFDEFDLFCKVRGFRQLTKRNVSNILETLGYETQKKDIRKSDDTWTRWTFILGITKKYDSTRSTRSTPYTSPFLSHVNQPDIVVERVERVEFIENLPQKSLNSSDNIYIKKQPSQHIQPNIEITPLNTTKTPIPQPILLNLNDIKDTLFAELSIKKIIEINEFLQIYPKNFHLSIEQYIRDILMRNGEIFEPKAGYIALL